MMAAQSLPSSAWLLGDLLDGMASVPKAVAELPVASLALDSRRVAAGALFLACQGERSHGLDYAEEVTAAGAAAMLGEPTARWSNEAMAALAAQLGIPVIPVASLSARAGALAGRFHGEPSAALEVIGITGTNGKTSVSHFIAQAVAAELRCALIGTLGEGFPNGLRPTGMTTPDALSVQESLARFRNEGAAAVAMEVSSHALAQRRVDAVRFDYAVLTNLTRDHLDYHGDMAAYAAAKARLFAMPGLGWAVLNADDPFSEVLLADLAPEVKLAFYSLRPEFDLPAAARGRQWLLVRAKRIEARQRGLWLEVESSRVSSVADVEQGAFSAPLIGHFNAQNLLAVLALLLARGSAFDRALHFLSRVSGVPGRMECFGEAGEPLCLVDYAHTPDALEQSLTELKGHVPGRLILVFGCGGERDTGKRALMGAIAERLADEVILTDDNPRREDGEGIIRDILSGMRQAERNGAGIRIERQRGTAIRHALLLAGPDDGVLVAGKGHETVQDMGDLKVRFSDRAQVVQALREWRGRS